MPTDSTVPAGTSPGECPPADLDLSAPGLARALTLAADWPGRGALCVIRHGRVVLNRSWGCPTRELVFVYLTNLLAPAAEAVRHRCAVSDAVLDACR